MLEKIILIVADGLGVDAESLKAETTFESLGADSLDLMDMIMRVEDEFDVEIDNGAIGEMKTIADVAEHVKSLQNS